MSSPLRPKLDLAGSGPSEGPAAQTQTVAAPKARRSYETVLGLAGTGVAIGLWQGARQLHLIPSDIPSPLDAIYALYAMIIDGTALRHVFASLVRVISGFVIGSMLAFTLCCTFWLWPRIGWLFGLSIELLRPVPPIALIPFAIYFLGLGTAPAVFLVSFAAFFPMHAVTEAAFRAAPADQLDVARTFGGSRTQILRYVVVPQSLPTIMSGLKTSAGISWFVVIVAELVGAQNGLGYLIQESRLSFQLDRAVAAIVLIAVSGLAIQEIVSATTKILTRKRGRSA